VGGIDPGLWRYCYEMVTEVDEDVNEIPVIECVLMWVVRALEVSVVQVVVAHVMADYKLALV